MPNDPLDIQKALTTLQDSTGNILVPEIISAGIREFFEKRTPLWNQIRKVPVEGNAIVIKEQTSIPEGSWGTEMGALPAAQNAAYAERAVPLKSLYTRGEVSGQLIASSRTFVDVLQREIRNHTLGMISTMENTLVTGNSTDRPAEFDGINTWVTNELNVQDAGADVPLVLTHIEELLDRPTYGGPNLLIMNAATRRRLWSVLQPQVRFIGETEINGGFRVRAYNDLPIIEVRPSANSDENLDGIILAVNTDQIYIPILQDLTYEELAHTRDSTDFIIKMYTGLVVEGPTAFHAKLTGFSTDVTA